jgi:hypothetical protein
MRVSSGVAVLAVRRSYRLSDGRTRELSCEKRDDLGCQATKAKESSDCNLKLETKDWDMWG